MVHYKEETNVNGQQEQEIARLERQITEAESQVAFWTNQLNSLRSQLVYLKNDVKAPVVVEKLPKEPKYVKQTSSTSAT